VIERIAGEISTHIGKNSHEALIRLEPPELGRLKIDLILEGDKVQARIVAEVAETKALIQTHLPELRQALQAHRLELGEVRMDVSGQGGEKGDLPQGFQQDPGGHAGRSQRSAVSGQRSAEGEIARSDQSSGVNVWA
jgi:flagellar hook-length control protein FliK